MLNNGLFQRGSPWALRDGQGTLQVLEFVKSCIVDEAVVVKEVEGWKVGWEERYGWLFGRVIRRREMGLCVLV